MKIKLLKSVKLGPTTSVPQGTVWTARKYVTYFMQINPPYQIIEGPLSGKIVPYEDCILIDEEKVYTEKEIKAFENVYIAKLEKERQEKERAQDLVKELTLQIKKKDTEIERKSFFLEVSKIALEAACSTIETLKENKAN